MQIFFRMVHYFKGKTKILPFFAAGYLFFATAALMVTPTNAGFTSTVTLKGQITISDSLDSEEASKSGKKTKDDNSSKESDTKDEAENDSDEADN